MHWIMFAAVKMKDKSKRYLNFVSNLLLLYSFVEMIASVKLTLKTAMIVNIDLNPTAPNIDETTIKEKNKKYNFHHMKWSKCTIHPRFFSTCRLTNHGRRCVVISATIRLWQTKRYLVKFQYFLYDFRGFDFVSLFIFFSLHWETFQAQKTNKNHICNDAVFVFDVSFYFYFFARLLSLLLFLNNFKICTLLFHV